MDIGKMGEQLTAQEYVRRGYKIIGMNVRLHGYRQIGELDVIAIKEKEVIFVEVKTRRSYTYGRPAEAVNFFKQKKLIQAAKMFLIRHPEYEGWDWRFDVAEVDIDKIKDPVIILENVIEDLN